MVRLKDFFNQKTNKRNKQIGLDLKKSVLKKFNIELKDILNIKLNSEKKKFCKFKDMEGRFDKS